MEVTTTEDNGYACFSTPAPTSGRTLKVEVFGHASSDWTVDWSATGSVAPADAAAYARLLGHAAEYAAYKEAAT